MLCLLAHRIAAISSLLGPVGSRWTVDISIHLCLSLQSIVTSIILLMLIGNLSFNSSDIRPGAGVRAGMTVEIRTQSPVNELLTSALVDPGLDSRLAKLDITQRLHVAIWYIHGP